MTWHWCFQVRLQVGWRWKNKSFCWTKNCNTVCHYIANMSRYSQFFAWSVCHLVLCWSGHHPPSIIHVPFVTCPANGATGGTTKSLCQAKNTCPHDWWPFLCGEKEGSLIMCWIVSVMKDRIKRSIHIIIVCCHSFLFWVWQLVWQRAPVHICSWFSKGGWDAQDSRNFHDAWEFC